MKKIIYTLFWRPVLWVSRFFEDCPVQDWPCWCATCRYYAYQDIDSL